MPCRKSPENGGCRTSSLYDTARYEKEMSEADREVKRTISTRMTAGLPWQQALLLWGFILSGLSR